MQGPDGEVLVDRAQVRGASGELLVWSWYTVGDISTSNAYHAKIVQTLARLGFSDSRVHRVIVATPATAASGDAAALLQDFVSEYVPLVYQNLRQEAPAAH